VGVGVAVLDGELDGVGIATSSALGLSAKTVTTTPITSTAAMAAAIRIVRRRRTSRLGRFLGRSSDMTPILGMRGRVAERLRWV
jgi:hypothetical protein